MRVRFSLVWIISHIKTSTNILIKEKFYVKVVKNNKAVFFYSFHFSSIFYPGSLKNVNLFLRSKINKEDDVSIRKNGSYRNNKILLKQSYLLVNWINYLCNISDKDICKKPSFFIHPYSQHKTTLTKSPLAHKTFSQEQFMTRYYKLSISFKPYTKTTDSNLVSTISSSMYASNFIRNNIPFVSTNFLFLNRISYFYNSNDPVFYSYYYFNK